MSVRTSTSAAALALTTVLKTYTRRTLSSEINAIMMSTKHDQNASCSEVRGGGLLVTGVDEQTEKLSVVNKSVQAYKQHELIAANDCYFRPLHVAGQYRQLKRMPIGSVVNENIRHNNRLTAGHQRAVARHSVSATNIYIFIHQNGSAQKRKYKQKAV